MDPIRLGVNIDHVATVRNARGGRHPEPVRAALLAATAGADGITVHLREDRRHIIDDDVSQLRRKVALPLNLEIAATEEMQTIALGIRPHAVCIVPERREEITTEGGLNVVTATGLKEFISPLRKAGIRVSLFIDADSAQVEAAKAAGAQVVEFHTGRYCHAVGANKRIELAKLHEAVKRAHALRLECHAGHGLTFENVTPVAAIPEIVELNIGHFLVGEAIFRGLGDTVREMKRLMQAARQA